MPQEAQLVIHDDETITPFWSRIPQFFLFPLQKPLLLVLGPLALATVLAVFLPLPQPLDILVVEGTVWVMALRHAFGVMERTAAGLLSPDRYERMPSDPDRVNLPWKLLGVLMIWGFIIGTLAGVSEVLGGLAKMFFTLAFPASVMALSTTNSLGQAVNPLLWLSIMRQVGRAYLALFVFLLLLSGGAFIVLPLLAPFLRGWLALPLVNFTFFYFNLIMFNMMGYVLYQYHRVLGVSVQVDFADAGAAAGRPAAKVDVVGEDIARRVAAGDLAGALDAAYEQQRLEPDNVAVQERYHKLLVLADKRDRALDHGRRYLSMLLRTGHDERAVEAYKRLRELDETFAPEQPGQVLPLAEAARRRREHRLALGVMRAFDKRHPRHPDIPGVYLLSARILSEHFKKDDLAAAILKGLRAKFPEHPLAAEADAYLKALENMRTASS